jgi:hypothetical protein
MDCSGILNSLVPADAVRCSSRSPSNPPEQASVRNIRYRMTDDSVQINIDLDSATRYESQCLENPDRIFFDIFNAVLKDDFQNRAMPIHDPLLKRIRVAQNLPDVVRVVLDISGKTDYLVSELQNPSRIVIELRSSPGSKKEPKKAPSETAALSNFSPSTDIERESAALSQDGTMKTVLQDGAFFQTLNFTWMEAANRHPISF